MKCLSCKAQTENEFYLCWDCLDHLRGVIEDIPLIMAELDVNVAKLSVRGKPGAGGSGGSSIHGAAPVDQTAVDVKHDLKKGVVAAAAAVARISHDHPAVSSNTEQVCVWLAEKADWFALNPSLAEWHGRLLRLYRKACATIDIPPDTMTVGVCGALVACGWPENFESFAGDLWCTRELVIRPGQGTITCRDCGTLWDVHQRRKDALEAAWLEPVRPGAIAAALKGWGMAVTLNAVQHWIKKGLLIPADEEGGYKRYRLVEAHELAHRIQLRRDARYESNA
jgi:hypothetical protein